MPKSSARIGSSIGEADAGEGAAIGMGAARRRYRVQSLAATAARAYGTKVQELLTPLAMDARIALARPTVRPLIGPWSSVTTAAAI